MQTEKLLEIIEKNLPPETAIEGDRLGLQVQSGQKEIFSILVTLELNDEVIEEAVLHKIDCIISFHPLIYKPLSSIVIDDRVGRLCSRLISNNISLIVVHTNFDAFAEGTSKIFADRLGLVFEQFLIPDNEFPQCGIGVLASSPFPMSEEELLERVSMICNSPLRYTPGKTGKQIDKIAIVGGSGSSFLRFALRSGAQAMITADITYHTFHEVSEKFLLIDPGHYEMEKFVPEALCELLSDKLINEDIRLMKVSEVLTNPVRYYPETEKYYEMQRKFLVKYRLNNKNIMVDL